MQTELGIKRKNNRTGVKVLIGILSLAGTFGLWNIFAHKAVADANNSSVQPGQDNQTNNQLVLEFPPMPTLVPVNVVNITQLNNKTSPQNPAGVLRQVSQPTLVPAPVNKPVFEQLTINRPGSSSSSSSRSGSSR
jgi:hypothetical protein